MEIPLFLRLMTDCLINVYRSISGIIAPARILFFDEGSGNYIKDHFANIDQLQKKLYGIT